ncbi:MAG: hypothetical protein Q8K75_01400 [Chlamydiales bacterium]|nr:hypothetical protein [Chlamydiales bacterium]
MLLRFLLCIFCFSALHAEESVSDKLSSGEVKGAIALAHYLLPKTPSTEKSQLQLQLAIAYVRDQEDESAFSMFLDSLQTAPHQKAPTVSADEQRLYDEALNLYLTHQGPAAHRAAKTIIENYGSIVSQKGDYYLLGFLVAAAKANLQHYDQFFKIFYDSYQRYPEHFLAYKTKALMNHKLWQRGRVPGEREVFRTQIKGNLEFALGRYPNDASLYKMMLAFSSDEEKPAAVLLCLNNIVQGNIIIPREDILFFVQAGISTGQREITQAFVNSARSWYKQSRALTHAQQLIDSQGGV